MQNKCTNDFNRTVKTYYKELNKTKPLDRDSERYFLEKAKNGDIEARNVIITSNLKFVFNVAKQYRGLGVDIEDLISEGNLRNGKSN